MLHRKMEILCLKLANHAFWMPDSTLNGSHKYVFNCCVVEQVVGCLCGELVSDTQALLTTQICFAQGREPKVLRHSFLNVFLLYQFFLSVNIPSA